MSDEQKKKLNDLWVINTDKFDTYTSPFGEQSHHERKFNFKIRNSDLVLIDSLAEMYGITRAALLNYLLMQGLKRHIKPTPNDSDSEEVKMLIARRADNKLRNTSFQRQALWQEDVIISKTERVIQEILYPEEQYSGANYEIIPMEDRHSASFNALEKFFKGIDKNEQ